MLNEILKDIDTKMSNCILNFDKEISKFNIKNINFDLIYNLYINYHGINTKLNKLININFNTNNSFRIVLFDKSIRNKVRNVIDNLNLNLTSNLDNNDIIINLPYITEEYRFKMFNLLKKELEKFKILIRNIRQLFRNKFKDLLKKKIINIDDNNFLNNNLNNITLKYNKLLEKKFFNKKDNILN